mgnify:CR=1 FL=1
MEFKGNEGLTELKVSYITEMINPVELVKDLTFDEVLTDADKMDMLMANGYNYKMMLEEKEEPHRKFMLSSMPTKQTCWTCRWMRRRRWTFRCTTRC